MDPIIVIRHSTWTRCYNSLWVAGNVVRQLLHQVAATLEKIRPGESLLVEFAKGGGKSRL